MPYRAWVLVTPLGLVVSGALFWGAYETGRLIGETETNYEAQSNRYAQHAEQQISNTCLRLDGVAQAECIRGIVEATNEQERAQQDLIAQTKMALWAFWMLIVTTAMAIITGIGVVFVWRTLLATQRMAGDQKHIGAAQTRAYLSLSEARFWVDSSGRPTFKLILRNTGNTPSFSGTENIAFVPSSDEIADSGSLENWFVRRDRFLIDLGAFEETAFTTGISALVESDPDWMMSAVVRITYKTVIDAIPREAIFTLVFSPEFDWPDEASCSIPDDHIDPRRSALFMARSILREVREGVGTC